MFPIVLENVSHEYSPDVYSLKNVSVNLKSKSITAILGKSGSGKSTLLQMINGIIRPTRGRIKVLGEEINYNDIIKLRRKIGYVVQGIGLFPHLSVQQNIALASKISPVTFPVQERVDALLEQVSLPIAYKYRYPSQLSGGEQQRIGLCRALFNYPEIILMDEPFGALDAITRSEIQQQILAMQKSESRTIIIVTHDFREAARLADDIIIIAEGVVQQYDTKDTVLKRPANKFVEALIKASL